MEHHSRISHHTSNGGVMSSEQGVRSKNLNLLLIRHLPRINQPSRINNIFGKTEISRRFRPQGESDGWADLFIGSPLLLTYCLKK
ncbi:hypothetical protein [Nostoc foliaceum]|uniref:Uncharacterized protein n=1 Tax=Nostoc linckia FACHB-391 TaxID=2692906 RepID=A0ABR8FBD3_NOSLI|nr:hypothetical protein [Nostoc foliaceum]MBD2566185.1 hypothetical protein [Nostoc linckia FACHB-391]